MVKSKSSVVNPGQLSLFDFNIDKYCLGKLCKKGHNHGGTGSSLRYLKNNCCVECARILASSRHLRERICQLTRTDIGKDFALTLAERKRKNGTR